MALAGGLALPAAGVSATPPARSDTYTNPVFGRNLPDPFVLRHGASYLAYGTNADWVDGPGGLRNIPVLRSDDLASWTVVGDALPAANLGRWVDQTKLPGRIWAPSVLRRWYGRPYWVLYYSAPTTADDQCIGMATAPRPAGPFVDRSAAPMICQTERDGSIDASPFLAPGSTGRNPQALLTWKSEDNVALNTTSIWAQRLLPSGLGLEPSEPTLLLEGDPTIAWERSLLPDFALIEGPTVFPTRGGKRYLLIYSSGFIFGTAAIGYAVCRNTDGLPTRCRRVPGARQAPWVTETTGAQGPGGQEVFADADGDLWMAYHARPTAEDQDRTLRVDQVCFRSRRRLATNAPTVGRPVALRRDGGCPSAGGR